jgi:hypothetical protein
MCDGSDTFGLTFIPDQRELLGPGLLQPVPGRSRCFTYKARPGDYPEKLVDRFGLGLNGLQQLVGDNLDHMPELDRFTPGAPLLVCDPDPRLLPASQSLPAFVPPSSIAALVNNKTIPKDALWLAASPPVFDGRSAWPGLSVIGRAKNQGECDTSVAFAVLAAAQTAAAVALNTSLPAASLSEHDLYFCAADNTYSPRSCRTGMYIITGVRSFLTEERTPDSVAAEECVPYQPDRGADACKRKCQGTAAQLWRGTWTAQGLFTVVDMQRHIRTRGSIICRLPLYSDIRSFYRAKPDGIFRPGERLTTSRDGGCLHLGYTSHGSPVFCSGMCHFNSSSPFAWQRQPSS